ncbi:MAG TPA: GTPase domain-containing protein, partial [Rubrivivax sp.]|nr:GTPase domain-containing protein [Rubrivivax sp.]
MTTVTLSLVSHTNAGKTTLARTLLGSDVGVVRDAPHVTQFADGHDLIVTDAGDRLRLWDTPGFGDSARLARRLQQRGEPLGWFLSEVWDRWRDHAFWASQQALRHVQSESDVVLYLANAAEAPQAAGYVAPEMDLLAWVGKPVLVLLNQLGAPQAAAQEAAEVEAWRGHLARWPLVRAVLPLDAFARCWVHEATLLQAVQAVLQGERAEAMARLAAAWRQRRQRIFEESMQVLAASLARTAAARETVDEGAGIGQRLRQIGGAVARRLDADAAADPAAAAQQRLAAGLEAEVRQSTTQLIELHGLEGHAQARILQRVAGQFASHQRVPEGKAAILGGAVTGALAGLKADIASGGFTLGGGLIAGGLIGALGAAGLARGINVVRGTGRSWVAWSDAAMDPLVEAALLRYLAVAHFGRGRGEWVQGEAPPHWAATVAEVLAAQREALAALWAGRSDR